MTKLFTLTQFMAELPAIERDLEGGSLLKRARPGAERPGWWLWEWAEPVDIGLGG